MDSYAESLAILSQPITLEENRSESNFLESFAKISNFFYCPPAKHLLDLLKNGEISNDGIISEYEVAYKSFLKRTREEESKEEEDTFKHLKTE